MQSKQNWCMHPLMDAISVMQEGVSRQMAQVKSAGGLSAVLIGRSCTDTPCTCARTPPIGKKRSQPDWVWRQRGRTPAGLRPTPLAVFRDAGEALLKEYIDANISAKAAASRPSNNTASHRSLPRGYRTFRAALGVDRNTNPTPKATPTISPSKKSLWDVLIVIVV